MSDNDKIIELALQATQALPANIRWFRQEVLGLSQEAFAEKISLDPANVYRNENGITKPSLRTVMALHYLAKQARLGHCLFDPFGRDRTIGFRPPENS